MLYMGGVVYFIFTDEPLQYIYMVIKRITDDGADFYELKKYTLDLQFIGTCTANSFYVNYYSFSFDVPIWTIWSKELGQLSFNI